MKEPLVAKENRGAMGADDDLALPAALPWPFWFLPEA
jgi:hypothetical protein